MYDFLLKLVGRYFNPFPDEDHLPCYINRAVVNDSIQTKVNIRKYIKACKAHKEGRIGMLLFSVTEDDKFHAKWLSVAQEENYQVVEGPSIHGDYKCWAIFVPNEQLGEMRYR